MKKDKDIYERLPQEIRDIVEAHGRKNGMSPKQVHAEYLTAQAILHPVKPWHKNLFKKHRRGT